MEFYIQDQHKAVYKCEVEKKMIYDIYTNKKLKSLVCISILKVTEPREGEITWTFHLHQTKGYFHQNGIFTHLFDYLIIIDVAKNTQNQQMSVDLSCDFQMIGPEFGVHDIIVKVWIYPVLY